MMIISFPRRLMMAQAGVKRTESPGGEPDHQHAIQRVLYLSQSMGSHQVLQGRFRRDLGQKLLQKL
jgi:hypothetical protein